MKTANKKETQLAPAGGSRLSLSPAKVIEFGEESGLGWVDLEKLAIAPEIFSVLPLAFIREHGVVPFARDRGVLRLAMSDPIELDIIDSAAFLTGEVVHMERASGDAIAQVISRFTGKTDPASSGNQGSVERIPNPTGNEDSIEGSTDELNERDAPIVKLVESIIADAVRRRASDIHLEPLERRFRVRYRIDGVLLEAENPPRRLQAALISRVKIMANLSIAEKRLPQDGRLQLGVDGRRLDLRVSSLPTAHGESIVMRILDQEGLKVGMHELGFLPEDQGEFERLITAPDGMVLVTGPTGSGKTTTLYSSLHHLNHPDRKIITVEDPVEYQLAGVNQVPVSGATGMTFASALRAMLRQAPNVVMVGEIRDRETAEIAINAAMTGHLVFSTLHTNDAPSAVTRLIDMGAKPFLVAAALRAGAAQRLVRRVCPACKVAHSPSAAELRILGVDSASNGNIVLYRGSGCAKCQGTGFQGRVGIFEIFLVNDRIRSLIYENVTAVRLRQQAQRDGMRTMRQDGVCKVLAGLTTIEEVVAATAGDPLEEQ